MSNMNEEQVYASRLATNKKILEHLEQLIESKPQERFGQIIANYVFPDYRIRDFFYEESSETQTRLSNIRQDHLQNQSFGSNIDIVCQSFVENISKHFISLYLYGESFSGKTNTITGILDRVKQTVADISIIYNTAFDFRREYSEAVRTNSVEGFIARYYTADIVVIEDIEELQAAVATQKILLHIWNNSQKRNSAFIITSNQPIENLSNFNERLLCRFKHGMISCLSMAAEHSANMTQ